MQADKLAEAVLQRAIVFFNESEGGEVVYQAMPLQQYALSIAEGEPTRQRCRENVAVLQGWVDDLSPQTVKQHLDRVISAPVESAPVAAASAGTTASAPRQVESPQAKSAASAPASQTSRETMPQAKPEKKRMSNWGWVSLFLGMVVFLVCLFVAPSFIAREFFPENRNAPLIICFVFWGVWILGSAIHSYFTEGLSSAIEYFLIIGGVLGSAGLFFGGVYIGMHFFDGSLLVVFPIAGAITGLIIWGIVAFSESDWAEKIASLLVGSVVGGVFGGMIIGVGKLSELILDFLK